MSGKFITTIVFIRERADLGQFGEVLDLVIEMKSSGDTSKIRNKDIIEYIMNNLELTTKEK